MHGGTECTPGNALPKLSGKFHNVTIRDEILTSLTEPCGLAQGGAVAVGLRSSFRSSIPFFFHPQDTPGISARDGLTNLRACVQGFHPRDLGQGVVDAHVVRAP